MRRDVSSSLSLPALTVTFSLHAQRCFFYERFGVVVMKVFSACAEMFLLVNLQLRVSVRFLCMRRDVSILVSSPITLI